MNAAPLYRGLLITASLVVGAELMHLPINRKVWWASLRRSECADGSVVERAGARICPDGLGRLAGLSDYERDSALGFIKVFSLSQPVVIILG